MNTRTLAIVIACNLALSACTEESPTAVNTQQTPLAPVANPLEVVPVNDQPVTPAAPMPEAVPPAPIAQAPDVQPPVQPAPDTQIPPAGNLPPPITIPDVLPVDNPQPLPPTTENPAPQGATLTVSQLVNGSTLNSVQTYWQCEVVGNTDPDDYLQIVFLEDQSGQLSSASESVVVNWDITGSTIYMSAPGSPVSIEFSATEFMSPSQFTATLSYTGSASAQVLCDQLTPGSAPVSGGSNQEGVVGSQGTLLNTVSASGPADFWGCELQNGEEVYIVFLAQGMGVLVSNDFPEGIEISWSESSQGVTMTLADGNQVLLTPPQFGGADYFAVSAVTVNGADNGFMDCELLSF